MVHVSVRLQVEDFAKWKSVFDETGGIREAGGSQGGRAFQSKDDPNDVLILLKWDSLENARGYVGSEELREAMQRAGVKGQPDVAFYDEVEKVTR